MPNDKGYYAGEEESQKIEDIIARRGEPEESVEEDREDYEEDVKQAKRVKEPRPLGTGEPIYLYIKTGTGVYTVVDTVFPSRIEARQFAEENFPGQKYKVMNDKDIADYMEKLQKRQQSIDETIESAREVGRKVKGGAQRVAGGFLEASRDVAHSQGMTREVMQPRIERAWGVQPKPPQGGINIQVGTQQVEPKPPKEPEPEPVQEPMPQRRPGMAMRQPQQRPMRFGAPQQRRTRINIPMGGGVFQPRGFRQPQQPRRSVNVPRGARVYDSPARIPRNAPIKKQRFNFGLHAARPHTITPRGVRPMGFRQPYEEVEETKTTRKYKTNKKSKRKKR